MMLLLGNAGGSRDCFEHVVFKDAQTSEFASLLIGVWASFSISFQMTERP